MRAVGHRDEALKGLSLSGVVEDRHGTTRLHDLQEEAGAAAEVRYTPRHASLAHAAVFRAVRTIEIPGGIVRRSLQTQRRRRSIRRERWPPSPAPSWIGGR